MLSNFLPKQFPNEYNAIAIKKEGNKFYLANKYEEALELYSKAILLGKFQRIFYLIFQHLIYQFCTVIEVWFYQKWVD